MTLPTFRPAQRKALRARVAIEGPSGSGKTWTALSVAVRLANGGSVAVIDTEHGSAELYADEFAFDTLQLNAPYSPERYVAAMTAAARAGYAVIVVDSLSHAWSGEGGVLSMVDATKNKFTDGWRRATPEHNLLIESLLASPVHVIATMRSKTEYALQTNSQGRQEPVKIGLAPVQRNDTDYEFALVGELDLQHTLTITKSRFNRWEPLKVGAVIRRPDGEWANTLLTALSSGADVGEARTAAEDGGPAGRAAAEPGGRPSDSRERTEPADTPSPTTPSGVEPPSPPSETPPDDVPGSVEAPASRTEVGTADPGATSEPEKISSEQLVTAFGSRLAATKLANKMWPGKSLSDLTQGQRRELLAVAP